MSMFGGLEISASGLTAERLRMDVAAEKLANAQTTRGTDGGPYRRKSVVLEQAAGGGSFGAQLRTAMGGRAGGGAPGGVQVAGIAEDPGAPRQIYDPGHPDANAQGYVAMPNVDTVAASKQMFTKTLELLR